MSIQQEQRDTAYSFAHHLKILQTYASTLGDLYVDSSSKCSISQNQRSALLCLWQQKVCSKLLLYTRYSYCVYMLFQVHDSGSFKLSVLQQLFDELCTVLYEGSLLLRKVESIHQDTCRTIRGAAREVLSFLESLIPITQNSKVQKKLF